MDVLFLRVCPSAAGHCSAPLAVCGNISSEAVVYRNEFGKTVMKILSVHQTVRHALFTAVAAVAALSCLVSCSKPAPEVPMERSRVLLRLFDHLDREEYDDALKDIETYRNLDLTNLFLSELEHIVRANMVIASARAKFDAGDVAGAAADLDAYYLKYGDVSPTVTDAKTKVDILLEAQRLNDKLLAAEFSEDLRAAATDLNAFAKANSKLFPKLPAYAAAKIKEADALAAMEKSDACVALFQDALEANANGRPDEAAALTALLELNADPAQRAGLENWLRRNPANK